MTPVNSLYIFVYIQPLNKVTTARSVALITAMLEVELKKGGSSIMTQCLTLYEAVSSPYILCTYKPKVTISLD